MMLNSSIEKETAYHLYEDIVVDLSPSVQWSWLDKYILYFPTYTPRKPHGIHRNQYFSLFAVIIIIIVSFSLALVNVHYTELANANPNIWSGNLIMIPTAHFVSRLCTLYYFYFKFDYPWYSTPVHFNPSSSSNYRCYIKFIVIVILMNFIIDFVADIYLSLKVFGYYEYIGNLIFFYIPTILAFLVHTSLCLKYENYLSELVVMVEYDTKTLDDVLTKYKSLYRSYKIEYVASLQITMKFFLLYGLVWVWFSILILTHYGVKELDEIAEISQILCYIILYVLPSILLSEQFDNFENALWKHGENMSEINKCHNFFLQYIKKHPIAISFGDYNVTKKHISKFALVFLLTKYAAYSFVYLASHSMH